jgi:hypothetical protein
VELLTTMLAPTILVAAVAAVPYEWYCPLRPQ